MENLERAPAAVAMERWKLVTVLLCCYGFFKELRPSEAFLTAFLKSPEFHNLTENEVDNQIYPVSTYSTLAWVFLVILTSDLLRQRPILVLGGLGFVATWILLIWGNGVFQMQMMQFTYGLAVASEIAYYSYVYLIVDLDFYRKATSITRVAVLIGRCSSGIIGQVLISLHAFNYLQLNYISLTSVSVAVILSLCMPAPRKVLLHQQAEEDLPEQHDSTQLLESTEENRCQKCCESISTELRSILRAVKETYSDLGMLKWSLWWALATCGYYQVGNYAQNLWDEISPARPDRKLYNGAVEAASTLLGAVMAYGVGFLSVDWNKYGEVLLCCVCLVDCVCLLVFSQTHNLYLAYGVYLLFRAIYQPGITAAYFQIASYLGTERYGLIFGTNTLIALVLETIGTVIVVDKSGLNLPVRVQFVIYGMYFGTIGIIFLIAAMFTLYNLYRNRQREQTLDE